MVDYKKTGKYVQTPAQDPTDIYVGKPEQVDYSGKSTRIDDNFTYIATHIGDGQGYVAGAGLVLTDNVFSVDDSSDSFVRAIIQSEIVTKQNVLTAGDHIQILNNVISVTGLDAYSDATTALHGLMSADDKAKLDSIDANANEYVLYPATTRDLGGVVVGANLTITAEGVLSATNTTYDIVIPPNGENLNGTAGLMSPADKAKLDTIKYNANFVSIDTSPASYANGTILIDNNEVTVYRHPRYDVISGTITAGKLINGIEVDNTGHVTGISTVNQAGINVSLVNPASGTTPTYVLCGCNYNDNSRTLELTKSAVGNIVIGVLDSSAAGTDPAINDKLSTVLQKIRNNISIVNNSLTDSIATKLQYKGTANALPSNVSNGDMYKVVESFSVGADTVVNGDLLIYDSPNWVVIPSGEKADTWRPVYVDVEGTMTPVLTSEAGSGRLQFKGSGSTDVFWEAASNSIVIHSNAAGAGGTGTTVYLPGAGLNQHIVTRPDPDNPGDDVTFYMTPATDSVIGGVIVGAGLSVNANGVISADAPTYTASHGVKITAGNDIQADFNDVAAINHDHTFDDITDIVISSLNANDVLTYKDGKWRNIQPTIIEYDAGDNIEIEDYVISATNTWRTIAVENTSLQSDAAFNLIAGTGIDFNTSTSTLANGSPVLNLTITATGSGGGGGGAYGTTDPIYIDSNNAIGLRKDSSLKVSDTQLGVKYNTGIFNVSSDTGLNLKYDPTRLEVNASGLTVKGSITDTDTWRNLELVDNYSGSTNTTTLGTGTDTGKLNLTPGSNVKFKVENITGGKKLTIYSEGGSGPGTTYYPSDGIDIDSGNNISVALATAGGLKIDENDDLTVKLDAQTDNAISSSANGLYVKAVSNGDGISISSSNVISVNYDDTYLTVSNGELTVKTSALPIGTTYNFLATGGLAATGNNDVTILTTTGTDSTTGVNYGSTNAVTLNPANKNGIYVGFDDSTIKKNNYGQLYVAGTSTLVLIDSTHNTQMYNSGAVQITLQNNTIYRLGSTINSITLSAASDMSYCTLCFTTPSSGGSTPYFSLPSNFWRCVGHDVSNGVFTPSASSEYQVAIDVLSGTTTLYILKLA